MKKQVLLFVCLMSASISEGMVLDGCPSRNFQVAGPDNIAVHEDGTMTIVTSTNDDMRGRWGGQVRAEVNSKHIATAGETIEYRYSILINDVPMDWPVVILQLKQSGHSPTIALEWRRNKVYIKHRYSRNGIEQGPTMAGRPIVPGKPMDWRIKVKLSHGGDGFIEVYDENEVTERYSGPTLLPGSDQVHLKYGIYSFRFVDGITSRKIRVLDCGITRLVSGS